MATVNAPSALRQWVSDWETRWRAKGIHVALRVSQDDRLNKAVTTLEAAGHVASVTVWGEGTIEYIVLDVSTNSEVVMWDKEFDAAAELRLLLDECAASFVALASEGVEG